MTGTVEVWHVYLLSCAADLPPFEAGILAALGILQVVIQNLEKALRMWVTGALGPSAKLAHQCRKLSLYHTWATEKPRMKVGERSCMSVGITVSIK